MLALAPGNTAVTRIVGGLTSGYCATGSLAKATPPSITTMTEITVAKIGRSTKNRESTVVTLLINRRWFGQIPVLIHPDLSSDAENACRIHPPLDSPPGNGPASFDAVDLSFGCSG